MAADVRREDGPQGHLRALSAREVAWQDRCFKSNPGAGDLAQYFLHSISSIEKEIKGISKKEKEDRGKSDHKFCSLETGHGTFFSWGCFGSGNKKSGGREL